MRLSDGGTEGSGLLLCHPSLVYSFMIATWLLGGPSAFKGRKQAGKLSIEFV